MFRTIILKSGWVGGEVRCLWTVGGLALMLSVILIVPAGAAEADRRQPLRVDAKETHLSRELERRMPGDDWVRRGFLPVTLHGADPSGRKDSSEAIQKTIDEAFENHLACFFPPGTYLVSRQLRCRQPARSMTQAHVLVGSAAGRRRPLLRLADSSPGFGDATRPLSVVLLQALAGGRERVPPAYNLCFRGIDLDLGAENDGAVGVYMHGAQGCTIQDVRVSATGRFHAGIRHMVGSGGGYQNIEVVGGKHAIDASGDQAKHPLVVGLTAVNQSEEIIRIETITPITVVGLHAEKEHGPCFTLARSRLECSNHLTLVDAVIRFRIPGQTLVDNLDRSVYLANVYAWQAGVISANAKAPEVDAKGNPSGWSHVREYSFSHGPESRLLDDRGPEPNNPPVARIETGGVTTEDVPGDIVLRHVWDWRRFPHFDAKGVIDVTMAPYRACPDDGTDDAEAIQRAIDDAAGTGRGVFLPKGQYHLGRTLLLRKDTALFGVSRNLTILSCLPSWTMTINTPMIDSEDDASATTTLAFLRLAMPPDSSRRIYQLRWRAGRHSIVREVWFEKGWANNPPVDMLRILVTGQGGGRWYNLFTRTGGDTAHPDHRYLLADGTREPLNIYAYCPEYAKAPCEYQAELRGSRNISIFGLKVETDLNGPPVSSLGIMDCRNVFVSGNTGIGHALKDRGIIEIKGSTDIALANMARWGRHSSPDWFHVLDLDSGKGIRESLPAGPQRGPVNNVASLFKKGHCQPIPILPVPSPSHGH